MLGFHSCHRIFDLPQSPHPGIDIQQREGSYLTFVLAIESKLFASEEKDMASQDFLWGYVREQVEEEATAQGILEKIRKADKAALLFIDDKLGQR